MTDIPWFLCAGHRSSGGRKTRQCRTGVLAVALALPTVAGAQDPIIRIAVDTAIKAVLPFDESFQLVGKAPAELIRVNVVLGRVADLGKGGCGETPPAGLSQPKPWKRLPGGAESFYVGIPPLEANAIYSFCIQQVSKVPDSVATKFITLVQGQLDRVLRRAPTEVTDTDLDKIKTALKVAIKGDADSIVIRDASLLDVLTRSSIDNLQAIAGIMQPKERMENALTNIRDNTDAAINALTALATNRATHTLLRGRYAMSKSAKGAIVDLDDRLYDADAVATSTLNQRADMSVGRVTVTNGLISDQLPAFAPATVWDVPALDEYQKQLSKSESVLEALRLFASRISLNPSLLKGSDIKPADVPGLSQKLEALARDAESRLRGIEIAMGKFQLASSARSAAITAVAKSAQPLALTGIELYSSSTASFETRARSYVSIDLGLAMLPMVHVVAPYFGANFYFVPVNKRIHLGKKTFLSGWSKRAALTVGLTQGGLKRDNVREDLFGSQSGLFGIGYRIADAVRIGTGVVAFRRFDPNSLIDHAQLVATPYLSAAFDWDAKAALGKVGDLLFH